ncbi:VanW family protein [Clostridioides difficile]|uniref:VanW family protein n=1 Tax=Clostridioides difficile TaxID=1496 RepID=UPI0003B29D34|nr:VanW family protein [Clostridioides difficile]AXU49682.1 vancomycin b-type resistance protein vanW [Clostridioides difficile]AXU64115.1 vancomycin b-type resistance protein vanW [Clostridioides difficile]AXU75145.1 vancomycin b-type resistance protein vanW [Clostridioides difficile]EGT2198772.1 hydrolase [Clostridioides difficile]EGT4036786.1 hydrolase [Clostridioides difficile]
MSNVNKKLVIAIGAVALVVIIFIGIMCIQFKGEKIAKNTYVNGVNIGKLTKSQAKQELAKKYKLENVEFNYNDKSWKVKSKDLNLSTDLDKTVENAYNLNRKSGFFGNLSKTISANFGKKSNLVVVINYDKNKLKAEMEKIAKEIDVDVKDATLDISGEKVKVIPDSDGLKMDISKSMENFDNQTKKGNYKNELVVKATPAKVKKEQLANIDTNLGTYSTTFKTSQINRSINIKLATDNISNVLLMPGETFSFNKHTGKRSKENGYKSAPVIMEGEMEEDYGGGVCQVSSTLYNSVLYAGLEIVNVKNHTIPSSYVPKGRDATVADSGIDFLFKNNLKHPVYIKNYVSGNQIVCNIYGSAEDKQNITISTKLDGVSQTTMKRVNDPTMPKGKEKVDKSGRNAYSVSTYRTFNDANGKKIKTEKIANSYYPKKEGIILVGTMEPKPEEKPNTDENKNNQNTNNQNPNNQQKPETPPTDNKPNETQPQPQA